MNNCLSAGKTFPVMPITGHATPLLIRKIIFLAQSGPWPQLAPGPKLAPHDIFFQQIQTVMCNYNDKTAVKNAEGVQKS
jgi:hypothetical protein